MSFNWPHDIFNACIEVCLLIGIFLLVQHKRVVGAMMGALEGCRVRFRDGDERVDGRKSEKTFPDEVFFQEKGARK